MMDRSWEKADIHRLIQLRCTVSPSTALKLTSIVFSQFAKEGGALKGRSTFFCLCPSDLVTPWPYPRLSHRV